MKVAELAVPLGPCWGRNPPPEPLSALGCASGADGATDEGGSAGTARAAFLLFNLSGCSSPPLPGLERDRGALRTLRAPSCKERSQWATAPEGRAGGGPSAPLSKQVSHSSPRTDFPRLSAKDISYCKVMMMRSPGDVRPCPACCSLAWRGMGCAVGWWGGSREVLGVWGMGQKV